MSEPATDARAGAAACAGRAVAVALRGLECSYGGVRAVAGIDVEVGDGEFFSLIGPSGCGKTTTLRMIAGLVEPTAGSIEVHGRDVTRLRPHRRPVNTVFQHYALFPHLDVFENVAFGLRERRVRGERDARRASREMLELVGLTGRERAKPAQLSGGQQQRVALARALVLHPEVLLLDEPLGALDLKLRKALQLQLKRIQREVGITFIYVTHDQEEAFFMSDRVAIMHDGLIEQLGRPQEVYERPLTEFVADFVGASNRIAGRGRRASAADGSYEAELDGVGRVVARGAAGARRGRGDLRRRAPRGDRRRRRRRRAGRRRRPRPHQRPRARHRVPRRPRQLRRRSRPRPGADGLRPRAAPRDRARRALRAELALRGDVARAGRARRRRPDRRARAPTSGTAARAPPRRPVAEPAVGAQALERGAQPLRQQHRPPRPRAEIERRRQREQLGAAGGREHANRARLVLRAAVEVVGARIGDEDDVGAGEQVDVIAAAAGRPGTSAGSRRAATSLGSQRLSGSCGAAGSPARASVAAAIAAQEAWSARPLSGSYSKAVQAGNERSWPGAVSAAISASGVSGAPDHNTAPVVGCRPWSERVRAALKASAGSWRANAQRSTAWPACDLLDPQPRAGRERDRAA